jgi:hypothetical protein
MSVVNLVRPRSQATGSVRPLVQEDVPAVAQLYERVFPGKSGLPPGRLESYLRDVFLENPWYDESIPALVYEQGERIVGFLGVVPRGMQMNGRHIRIAVASKLMVEPQSRRSSAAFHLVKRLFSGPQELTFTDLANDAGRKLWEAFGGKTSLLYSLYWTRLLSPTLFAISHLTKNRASTLVKSLRPLSLLDVFVRRVAPFPPTVDYPAVEEELTGEKLCRYLSEFTNDRSLVPEYDAHSIGWLLEMASRREQHGILQKILVFTPEGKLAGWYVYLLRPGGVSEVLQVYGHQTSIGLVLDRLFHHAWQHGAIAITGRMEPKFIEVLWSRRCFFGLQGDWFVAYSRRPEILDVINSGKPFLTRLEGEL